MHKHTLWYTRKNGDIKGPFPPKVISQHLVLGRLKLTDEVSVDRLVWHPISEITMLIPDVLRIDLSNETNQQMLEVAKRNADERLISQPYDGERRSKESLGSTRPGYQTVDEVLEERNPPANKFKMIVFVVLFVGLLISVVVFQNPGPDKPAMDCAAAPGPGVNWSNCQLLGVKLDGLDMHAAIIRNANLSGSSLRKINLEGSDLAYSNLGLTNMGQAKLKGALLTGASFQGAYMRGADLRDADLRYVDFWGADLMGVSLSGAKLDHAVWIDRRVCAVGSVGECILDAPTEN